MGCQSCESVLAQSIKTNSIIFEYNYWFMKQQLCLPVCLCMRAWINGILHSPAFATAPKGRQLLQVAGESEESNETLKRQTWCPWVAGRCLGAVSQEMVTVWMTEPQRTAQRAGSSNQHRTLCLPIPHGCVFITMLISPWNISARHCSFKSPFQCPCERVWFPFSFLQPVKVRDGWCRHGYAQWSMFEMLPTSLSLISYTWYLCIFKSD